MRAVILLAVDLGLVFLASLFSLALRENLGGQRELFLRFLPLFGCHDGFGCCRSLRLRS